MNAIRAVLIATGAAAGAFGISLLLGLGQRNLIATVEWLAGGVVLHDAFVGPAVIAAAFVVARLFRGRVPAAVIVGGIVLATVTVVAIPVLGRFGQRPDNTTLLNGSYGVGWLVFAGLTLLLVLVLGMRGRRRSGHTGEGGGDGTGPGRR
ncbi:MAG: hypothetical protein JWQ32_3010 [Marmoricola sp.]|nr:hypothetical protein [Marmoricola sp.]